eukprot:11950951-Alexandrium_andersonii.AAC.1
MHAPWGRSGNSATTMLLRPSLDQKSLRARALHARVFDSVARAVASGHELWVPVELMCIPCLI